MINSNDDEMARVLLVDDLNFVKIILRNILEENGFSVVGDAADGVEGVQKYEELQPDLVILDLTMPKMDGVEALKEIKKIDPDARVIICSAMGQENIVVQAIEAGASEFVIKPFSAQRILSAVNTTLGISEETNSSK